MCSKSQGPGQAREERLVRLAGLGEGPSGVGKLLRRAVAEAPLDGPRLFYIMSDIYGF